MPSRRKIAQSATFAKLESASAVAETSRTSLTRARGFSSPEMIRNAELKGPAEVQALLNALKTTASGRRQVEKESGFSAAGRVRTVAASYWRYHDFPHHWPGAEHRNDRAVAKAPTFESGRSGSCVGANDGINHLVISGMVARVSGGQPHLQRFPLVRPNLRGDRAVFGLSIPPTLTSRHEVPLHLSTGNTEDKHEAGIRQSSPAGTCRHSS